MAQSLALVSGPHYFLHQKSKSTFAVDGSPIAGACLFDRNFESTVLRLRSEEWRIRSLFFAVSPERFLSPNWSRISKPVRARSSKAKCTMDSAGKTATVRFPLANPPANQFFHTSRTRKSIIAG